MSPDELKVYLQELLKAHGLETTSYDQWLVAGGQLPALRGTWHAETSSPSCGCLEIEVALGKGRTIEECFTGLGEGSNGCRNALQYFELCSLHVLLGALWGRVYEDQVELEDWQISSGHWKAFIGPFVPRTVRGKEVSIPPGTFEAIETVLKGEELDPGLHWVRTFFCNIGNGETVVEALLDNEPWEVGARAFSEAGWKASEHYYSVRSFLVLDDASKPFSVWRPTKLFET